MIAAETLAMLNPQPVDDPDTITVEFGTEAAVLHLKIEGRRYEVEVPRIGGRDMGGCLRASSGSSARNRSAWRRSATCGD